MDELKTKLANMPKVELHVHVEGATDPEVFYTTAKRNNVVLPVRDLEEWKNFFVFTDFDHFIQVYRTAVSTLKTIDDYAYIIEKLYEHQSRQNIIYTEAFLSATYMVNKFDHQEAIAAIKAAQEEGERKYGVKINLIGDISRQEPDQQKQVFDFVCKGYEAGVFIGLGLGGMEIGFPPSLFSDTYKYARLKGLKVTAHAGEVVGPDSIWGAIRDLNVHRVGHGITCLEDPNLVKYLKDTQLPLEVCPRSGYCTKAVKEHAVHPIRAMVDAGLYCTISSDDPSMFSTSLNDEYSLLVDQGFQWQELLRLNENSFNAAFLSEPERRNLLSKLTTFQQMNENGH